MISKGLSDHTRIIAETVIYSYNLFRMSVPTTDSLDLPPLFSRASGLSDMRCKISPRALFGNPDAFQALARTN